MFSLNFLNICNRGIIISMEVNIGYLLLFIAVLAVINAILLIIMISKKGKSQSADLSGVEKRLDDINHLYSEQMQLFFQENRASSGRIENAQKESLQEISNVLDAMRDDNFRTMESVMKSSHALTEEVRHSMDKIREENASQLDKMRMTVDEKLQSTLETRISRSFEQVTKNLESLYASIGEMNRLSSDISSLSRMFSNVKSRGIWGEVQAESIIADIMAPSQYVRNYSPKGGSGVVEFAVRLPGRDDGSEVFLPIDSKFPREGFLRYSDAIDADDDDAARSAVKELRLRVLQEARDIRDKYIAPPETTDFAILFVPTESLYAELLRIDGFAEELQSRYRVVLTGPTNFSALLNSLQLGFRTLQVEKNTRKVWELFRDLKLQFHRFGEDLEKTQAAMDRAQDRLGNAVKRSSIITGRLGKIELPDAGVPHGEEEGEGSEITE